MRTLFKMCASALVITLAGCGDGPTQPASAELAKTGGTPGDVTATSVLTVTSLNCVDEGGGGPYYNITFCWATASGGTGAYTWSWNVIVTSADPNASEIWGVCTDHQYNVTVTVSDGWNTASRSGTFRCYALSNGGIDP